MKLPRTREVYWLDASASVTRVIENVTPTTVIIELAIVESICRAPSAPTPNSRGQRVRVSFPTAESASIAAAASTMLIATIKEGMNQKLDLRSTHSCRGFFMLVSIQIKRCLRHSVIALPLITALFLEEKKSGPARFSEPLISGSGK
jgi:hypothetical protein